MFPSPTLQSDAVKHKHVLDKQLFMHCVKKTTCFSMAPRNISDSNENYRRYNFQAFPIIKFPENLQPYMATIMLMPYNPYDKLCKM